MHYKAVRDYINVCELLATGISEKTFDEDIAFGFWSSLLKYATTLGNKIIERARKEDNNMDLYVELELLIKKWKNRY